MTVLADHEIKRLLSKPAPLVTEFPPEWDVASTPLTSVAWDTERSPVQPSSIDLHVGEIYVPGANVGELGSHDNPHQSFSLASGMSVVVLSHERLQLPINICAIALPPSRISSAGVLIANFGHIDPGYRGRLRFTLINMGKESFNLQRGAAIMTLLLLTTSVVDVPYQQRVAPRSERPTVKEIECLAPDFANVKERTTKIAATEIDRAVWLKSIVPMLGGAVIAAVVTTMTIGLAIRSSFESDLREFQTEKKKEVEAFGAEVLKLHLEVERLKVAAERR